MKNRNKIFLIRVAWVFFLISISLMFVSAESSISLDGTGEVIVNDANSLDGFSKATWNMWIKQDVYNSNAGIAGKYRAVTGGRSYLIRTSLVNGNSVSVALSSDGINTGLYTSYSKRECGIRENNEWTMITVVYDGSLIKYYRNGVLCDEDTTNIKSIYNSNSPLRLGGGNSIFFNGGIDEFTFYDNNISVEQIKRLYDESVYGEELGQSIPVLVYHKIEYPADYAIIVSPEQFQLQMNYLYENDFNTITLDDYNNWREGTYTLPKNAIIIIFDDGFSTTLTTAKPIMDEYGFKGTVMTVTRYASFTGENTGYMRWTETKELTDAGWDVESHGVTHAHMLTLNESQFRYELSYSKELLTTKTGKIPTSFVFPFHESNSTYTEICGEYYDLCWTQGSLNPSYDFKSTPAKEYLGLRRINVVNTATMTDFANYLGRDTDKFGEWVMEEGVGSTTEDTSGNNNLGRLLNGAFWVGEDYPIVSMMQMISSDNIQVSAIDTIEKNNNKKESKNNKKEDKNNKKEDGLDYVIESDKGKSPIKLKKEDKKWPENMDIEGEYYATHDLSNMY